MRRRNMLTSAVSPCRIRDTGATVTIVDGEIVYSDGSL